MSRRLRTRRFEPVGLFLDGPQGGHAAGPDRSAGAEPSSALAEPVMTASGGAQIVRDRAEERAAQPLGLDLHLGRLRFLGEARALERRGDLRGEDLEQGARLRIGEAPRRWRPQTEDAEDPARADQREVQRARRRKRVGAETGGATVGRRPAGHGALALVEGEAVRRRFDVRRLEGQLARLVHPGEVHLRAEEIVELAGHHAAQRGGRAGAPTSCRVSA